MFIDFFNQLRDAKVPVTIREYLMLLDGLEKGVCGASVDDFYFLARASLVKDEKYFDAFDTIFGSYFQGLMKNSQVLFQAGIPDQWLRAMTRRVFTDEEIEKLEKMGFEELLEELAKRLEEQDKAHSGGSKWIGTGGTSPFGNSGRNPVGIRIGGEGGGEHLEGDVPLQGGVVGPEDGGHATPTQRLQYLVGPEVRAQFETQ